MNDSPDQIELQHKLDMLFSVPANHWPKSIKLRAYTTKDNGVPVGSIYFDYYGLTYSAEAQENGRIVLQP